MTQKLTPHVHSMAIFDCPRVQMVRDEENGCLTLKFGSTTLNVYGEHPYKKCPELVEIRAQAADVAYAGEVEMFRRFDLDGTSGQDRESYSDDQDRRSYSDSD